MLAAWVTLFMVGASSPPPTVICVAVPPGPEWPSQIAVADLALALKSRVEATRAVVRLCPAERLATSDWLLQLVTLPEGQIRFDLVSQNRPLTGRVNTAERSAESATQLIALAIAESLRPALQHPIQGPRHPPPPPPEPEPPPTVPPLNVHEATAALATPLTLAQPWADVGATLTGAWLITPERPVARASLWAHYRVGELGWQLEAGGGLWPTHTHRQVTIAAREFQGGIGPTYHLGIWRVGAELQWRYTALTLDSDAAPLVRHQVVHADLGAALTIAVTLWNSPNQTVEFIGTGSGWNRPLRLRREGQWLVRQSRWELGLGVRWSLPWR